VLVAVVCLLAVMREHFGAVAGDSKGHTKPPRRSAWVLTYHGALVTFAQASKKGGDSNIHDVLLLAC